MRGYYKEITQVNIKVIMFSYSEDIKEDDIIEVVIGWYYIDGYDLLWYFIRELHR